MSLRNAGMHEKTIQLNFKIFCFRIPIYIGTVFRQSCTPIALCTKTISASSGFTLSFHDPFPKRSLYFISAE